MQLWYVWMSSLRLNERLGFYPQERRESASYAYAQSADLLDSILPVFWVSLQR
jgi:hypothetical protein